MFFSREVLVAFSVGIIIIAGAFYVRAGDEPIQGEVELIAKPPQREYIPTTDTDGDGVSDWAEELLGDREAINLAIDTSDEEEYIPPETLTGRFGVKFFQDYLLSKGLGDFGDTKEELAEQAVERLEYEARDYSYGVSDITIGTDDSTAAKHAYGNAIAEIESKYSEKTEYTEMEIVNQALEVENPKRLAELDPIITAYGQYLEQTKALPVPPSLVQQHLDLINVYSSIHKDLVAMRNIFEDPLLGLVRFKRYQEDIRGLVFVYFSIDLALRRDGVTYDDDEPGAVFKLLSELRSFLQTQ